ncbi:MAG TPA: hypothetical protein VI276_03925, partial [Actinomycetota bacterium]
DRDPTLVVPELERALAAVSAAGGQVELATWRDGADPYEAIARLLPGSGRIGVSDRIWAVHALGLQAAAPALSWTSASPVLGPLRARVALRIDGPRPLPVVADGSVLGTTPVTFQVVPRQILLKL